MHRYLLFASAATFWACNGGNAGPSADRGCARNADCEAGQVCIESECEQVCSADDTCPSGEICVSDVCQPGRRTEGPKILSVDGDGTPDPEYGPHHIAGALVITGENLEGASAEFSKGEATIPLDIALGATNASLTAKLPSDLAKGTYTLRVFNSAGEDQTNLKVLQGEQGPEGPVGPPGSPDTGEQIIEKIENARDAGASLDADTVEGFSAAALRGGVNDNFEQPELGSDWVVDAGSWIRTDGGRLQVPNQSGPSHIHILDAGGHSDVRISVNLSYDNGANAGIYFRLSDAGGFLWRFRSRSGETDSELYSTTGFGDADNSHLGQIICSREHDGFGLTTPEDDGPLELEILVVGTLFKAQVNGKLVLDGCTLPPAAPGATPLSVGLYADGQGNQSFDDFAVTSGGQASVPELLGGAIRWTAQKLSGTEFVEELTSDGSTLCMDGFHVCNAWEYSIISILAQNEVRNQRGWITGGFENRQNHARSLVNGPDSEVCGPGKYMISYNRCCNKEPPWGGYFGRLHCSDESDEHPVTCCRDNVLGGLRP